MKKSIFFVCMAVALVFSSCASFQSTVQAPKFTSVDRLCQIQPGNSYDMVTQTLGCDPYNLLSIQQDGYAIYLYKYKFIERELEGDQAKILNQRGGETAGMEVYVPKIEDAILIFKDNKLESVLTVQGKKDSPSWVMLHNTVFEISKEKGKYVIIPTEIKESECEEEKSAGGLLNFSGKKK